MKRREPLAFANGEWSQIDIIMPIVTRLITGTVWSSYVMQEFPNTLRASGHYLSH